MHKISAFSAASAINLYIKMVVQARPATSIHLNQVICASNMATAALYASRRSRNNNILRSSSENAMSTAEHEYEDVFHRTRPADNKQKPVKRTKDGLVSVSTSAVTEDGNNDERTSQDSRQARRNRHSRQLSGLDTFDLPSPRRDAEKPGRTTNLRESRPSRSGKQSSRLSHDLQKKSANPKQQHHARHESWNGTQRPTQPAESKRAQPSRSASTPHNMKSEKETPKTRNRWSSFLAPLFRSSATPAETKPSSRTTMQCSDCANHVSMTHITTLDCGHRMCDSCLRRKFTLSIENEAHMPPRCCTAERIPLGRVDTLFDDKFLSTWNKKYQSHKSKNRPRSRASPSSSSNHSAQPKRTPTRPPQPQNINPNRAAAATSSSEPQHNSKSTRFLSTLQEDDIPTSKQTAATEELFGNAAPNFLNENFIAKPTSLTMKNLEKSNYGRRGERESGRSTTREQGFGGGGGGGGDGGLAADAFGTQSMLGFGPPPPATARPRRESLLRTMSKRGEGEEGGSGGMKEGGGFRRWLSRL